VRFYTNWEWVQVRETVHRLSCRIPCRRLPGRIYRRARTQLV